MPKDPHMIPARTLVFTSKPDEQVPKLNHRFWLTVPGLPDGRPWIVCEWYHYITGTKGDDGKWRRKVWWGILTWREYNPLEPRTGFTKPRKK